MPIHYILLASAGAAFSPLRYIAGTALAGVFQSIAAPSLISGCREHGLGGSLFQLPGQPNMPP